MSLLKNAGVHEFELRFVTRTSGVLIDKPLIRERLLGIVVPPAQPGMARDTIEIPPVLFDVLAMVSLRTGQAEHSLFQDRIDAVPQSQRKAKIMMDVGKSRHPVFVPSVRPGSRMIMRKEVPGVAVIAVVLAYGAPGPLREVGTPLVPGIGLEQIVLRASRALSEPGMLGSGVWGWRSRSHDLS